jgi:hypothetical protein
MTLIAFGRGEETSEKGEKKRPRKGVTALVETRDKTAPQLNS